MLALNKAVRRFALAPLAVAVAVAGLAVEPCAPVIAATAPSAYPPSGSPTIELAVDYAIIGGSWFVTVTGATVGDEIDTELTCADDDVPRRDSVTVSSDDEPITISVPAPTEITFCNLTVSMPTYGLTSTFEELSTYALGPPPVVIPTSSTVPTTNPPATTLPPQIFPGTPGGGTTSTSTSDGTSALPETGSGKIVGWALLGAALLAAGVAMVKIGNSGK